MALSQKNSNVGKYIATYSSICPVLVTGLGGLYSRLPNQIDIKSVDWYRITTDDVTEMPELTLFMNSLEFCNAVVQVAHTAIRQQLLDFLYQGFLVPVLGPAILQVMSFCSRSFSLFVWFGFCLFPIALSLSLFVYLFYYFVVYIGYISVVFILFLVFPHFPHLFLFDFQLNRFIWFWYKYKQKCKASFHFRNGRLRLAAMVE